MGILREKATCEQLARGLYLFVCEAAAHDQKLSVNQALQGEDNAGLGFEMHLARMFAVMWVCQKELDNYRLCERVLNCFRHEFYESLKDSSLQKKELSESENLLQQRCAQYYRAMRNTEGAGPFFHLGKAIASNLHKEETWDAHAILEISVMMGGFMEAVSKVLSQYRVTS